MDQVEQPSRAPLPLSAVLPTLVVPRPVVLDPYRAFIFPNRIRELRTRHGFPTLLALASALDDIPYIRLSKIERGEVVARADEIARIAGLLGVAPDELLIDVDNPAFDIAGWSEPVREGKATEQADEEFAILLAAAVRARRARMANLTIAVIERDYGIPPVILSRIENAVKTLDRWNEATLNGLCRLFDVADVPALRLAIEEQYLHGLLDDYVGVVADPEARLEKTRTRIAALRKELASTKSPAPGAESPVPRPQAETPAAMPPAGAGRARVLAVRGTPLPGGLIAASETNLSVDAPRAAGPRAFALRVCRPTLGVGLPGNAIVIADPDVFPLSGGLAVVREEGNYRLLAITFDLHGAMIGHSVNPSLEMPLDGLDPSSIATVIAASFI